VLLSSPTTLCHTAVNICMVEAHIPTCFTDIKDRRDVYDIISYIIVTNLGMHGDNRLIYTCKSHHRVTVSTGT